jgi:hypothetical protein
MMSRTDAAAELVGRVGELEQKVEDLERRLRTRVSQLEEGMREQRALSQRLAVLSDFVAEVLGASARGDREELQAALARYSDGL